MKINKSKTEGLWLGAWKCGVGIDEPFGISWPRQYVTALGIAFPYNVRVRNKINFEERLAKLKKVLNIWVSVKRGLGLGVGVGVGVLFSFFF